MNTLFNIPEVFNGRQVFCYGAGNIGQQFAQFSYLLGIFPDYFIDRNLCNKSMRIKKSPSDYVKEVPIISVEDAKKYGFDNPIIVTMMFPQAVVSQLTELGFTNIWVLPFQFPTPKINGDAFRESVKENAKAIDFVRSHLSDKRSVEVFDTILEYEIGGAVDYKLIDSVFEEHEYFPSGIFELTEDSVFIDGGCYDNKTAIEFAERTNGNYRHIYSFEPSYDNMIVCKANSLPRQTFFLKALSAKNGVVQFLHADQGSHIVDVGDSTVESIKIDSLEFEKSSQLYIKLDVEGADMDALVGAQRTIKKYKPLLAVSIYHKLNDLWEIPEYLIKKYPFYNFYIRHHTSIRYGTDLYCVPK